MYVNIVLLNEKENFASSSGFTLFSSTVKIENLWPYSIMIEKSLLEILDVKPLKVYASFSPVFIIVCAICALYCCLSWSFDFQILYYSHFIGFLCQLSASLSYFYWTPYYIHFIWFFLYGYLEWEDKEEGKEVNQQWEDDWDDDDVNDDFSLQLKRELESNAEKK